MLAPPDIRPTDPFAPEALALIGESEAELSALYPPEVRYAFSPEQLAAEGVRFFVGWRGGEALACGGLGVYQGFGELKRIFTTRRARGQGLARAMVARLEAEARALGLPVVRLETGEDSPEAVALYAALGYVRRGPFAAYEDNGSSVFMEKVL